MFSFFFTLLIVIHIIISAGLIIIVLLQSGKGGGLSGVLGGGGGGGDSAFGARGAATFLSKATAWFAVLFFISCFTLAILSGHKPKESGSVIDKARTEETQPTQP